MATKTDACPPEHRCEVEIYMAINVGIVTAVVMTMVLAVIVMVMLLWWSQW